MLIEFLKFACIAVNRYGRGMGNFSAASEILNTQFAAALRPFNVQKIVVVNENVVTLVIGGTCTDFQKNFSPYLSVAERTIDLNAPKLTENVDAAARDLEKALGFFATDGDGAYVWIVPDGYMAGLSKNEQRWEKEGGGYFSHEALCVQNSGAKDTRCELFIYFEAPGREVLRHEFRVEARRSIHLRLDKIPGPGKEPFISKSTPVGYKVVSYDAPVVVQGSRILTSGKESEFASFGTTMGWCPL